MKIKQIIIAATLLVSVAGFAQKDELKSLKKIYAKDEIKGDDLIEYKALVNKLEPIATEESDKIYTNFYKSMIPILEMNSLDQTMTPLQIQMKMAKTVTPKAVSDLEAGLNATLDFEKKSGKKIYTDDINETIGAFKPTLLNYAISLGNAKKYKESSDVLYSIYKLDKKDKDNLYYAAYYAQAGEDNEKALSLFQELKAIGYTGEGTQYLAKNKASGAEEPFSTKEARDNMIALGTHSNPREEKIPSKKGEIYKAIAETFTKLEKFDEAKLAFPEAKKLNPNDTSLLLTEAGMYLKLKDMTSFKSIANEIITKDPNNAEMVFNLGVISNNSGDVAEAEKYYRRAIEIDPSYVSAYINLSELLLRADDKLFDEMQKLGTSEKDTKRYTVLKGEREKNFKGTLPILEKAVELDSKNEAVAKVLLSVYKALEMDDKVAELKAKMKQ